MHIYSQQINPCLGVTIKERQRIFLGANQSLKYLHVIEMDCLEETRKSYISFYICLISCIRIILSLVRGKLTGKY